MGRTWAGSSRGAKSTLKTQPVPGSLDSPLPLAGGEVERGSKHGTQRAHRRHTRQLNIGGLLRRAREQVHIARASHAPEGPILGGAQRQRVAGGSMLDRGRRELVAARR